MKELLGTGVALVTPFNEDKSVDFEGLARLVNYQIDNGVNYLVVLGTTGEPATLSAEEKEQVRQEVEEKVLAIKEDRDEKIEKVKSERNNEAVKSYLLALEEAAKSDKNLMPLILQAVEAYATLGEIADILRNKFGEYQG